METLNESDRILFQQLLSRINNLESLQSKREEIRQDFVIRYAAEMLFIKAGEIMKRFRDTGNLLFNAVPVFKRLTHFRDRLAHVIDTDIDKVISGFDEVPLLKKEAENILLSTSYEDEAFASFEISGGIGSKQDRQRFIDALVDRLSNVRESDVIQLPDTPEIAPFSEVVTKIIAHPNLLILTQQNSEIAKQISQEVLIWSKKTHINIQRDYPFEEEESVFYKVKEYSHIEFLVNFLFIKKYLSTQYNNRDLAIRFYNKMLKSIIPKKSKKSNVHTVSQEEEKRIIAIKNNFLNEWKLLLDRRRFEYESSKMNEARSVFENSLYQRIEQYRIIKKILEPFTNDLESIWNISGSIWNKNGLNSVQEYFSLLQNNNNIAELAALLGRIREGEIERDKETYTQPIKLQEWKIEHAHKSEFIGIKESDDINSLLNSEIIYLTTPETEDLFIKKFNEKKLLTYDYQNRYKATILKEGLTEKSVKNKGPFIICVDTSGSMAGKPEQLAKIICLSILKITSKEKRPCFLIAFNNNIRKYDLSNVVGSIDYLIEFLSLEFSNETDIKSALKEAIVIAKAENFINSDILVISDFVIPKLESNISNAINELKSEGTKFYSINISSDSINSNSNLFDRNWLLDPTNDESSTDLMRELKNSI